MRVVLVSHCKVNKYFDRVQSTCPFDSWQSEHSDHIFIALTDGCTCLSCLLCLVNTLYKYYQTTETYIWIEFWYRTFRISGKDNLRHSCFICNSPVCNTLNNWLFLHLQLHPIYLVLEHVYYFTNGVDRLLMIYFDS